MITVETSTSDNSVNENLWWAMSAVYNRSLKLKEQLDERNVHCFVPLRQTVVVKGLRKINKTVPAISNLIFIYTTSAKIKSLKSEFGYLQYLMRKSDGKSSPIVVPDNQMQDFITVASALNDNPTYISTDEIDLTRGEKVRIVAGPLAGVTGIFQRVKGSRSRRVIVAIEGVTAIATTSIPLALIEKI